MSVFVDEYLLIHNKESIIWNQMGKAVNSIHIVNMPILLYEHVFSSVIFSSFIVIILTSFLEFFFRSKCTEKLATKSIVIPLANLYKEQWSGSQVKRL